jgi:hypothetical protein
VAILILFVGIFVAIVEVSVQLPIDIGNPLVACFHLSVPMHCTMVLVPAVVESAAKLRRDQAKELDITYN